MSGQLRALKNRIRGIESTKKITKAMEMVAASKLKRFQNLKQQAQPYQEALEGILKRLLRTEIPFRHPLLEPREEKTTALFLLTSDTGLCGSFNYNLVEEAKKFLVGKTSKPTLIGFGKNGVNALSRLGYASHTVLKDIKTSELESVITKAGAVLTELFCGKKVDAVYMIYTHFTGKHTFRPALEKLLPFSFEKQDVAEETAIPYIMEPGPEALFQRLVPLHFEMRVRMAILESLVAEQMARRNAMSQATENATELIDELVLLRNKMRQAAITKELIEIVSGSKALKQ